MPRTQETLPEDSSSDTDSSKLLLLNEVIPITSCWTQWQLDREQHVEEQDIARTEAVYCVDQELAIQSFVWPFYLNASDSEGKVEAEKPSGEGATLEVLPQQWPRVSSSLKTAILQTAVVDMKKLLASKRYSPVGLD